MIFVEDAKKDDFNAVLIEMKNSLKLSDEELKLLDEKRALVEKYNEENIRDYSELLIRMQLLDILSKLSEDIRDGLSSK